MSPSESDLRTFPREDDAIFFPQGGVSRLPRKGDVALKSREEGFLGQ